MVAVAMGGIDRGEVFAGGLYPLGQSLCLGGGHERVDQDGVALAHDQRGRDRRPGAVLLAGWEVVAYGHLKFKGGYEHVPGEVRGLGFHEGVLSLLVRSFLVRSLLVWSAWPATSGRGTSPAQAVAH